METNDLNIFARSFSENSATTLESILIIAILMNMFSGIALIYMIALIRSL